MRCVRLHLNIRQWSIGKHCIVYHVGGLCGYRLNELHEPLPEVAPSSRIRDVSDMQSQRRRVGALSLQRTDVVEDVINRVQGRGHLLL